MATGDQTAIEAADLAAQQKQDNDEAEAKHLEDEGAAGEGAVGEADGGDPADKGGEASDEGSGDGELVVTIAGEAEPEESEAAPEWVRKLRKDHRELQREKRELEDKLKASVNPPAGATVLGVKPTLESFDYDTEKFEQALTKWYDKKREIDEAALKADNAKREQEKAWQAKLQDHGKAKEALKAKDYDDAEAVVFDTLDITQQGIILQGAENSALVMYALGKNPKKAKELAGIKDHVKFAFAIAKLETQLKITPRKAPPPEKQISGSQGHSAAAADGALEKLRAEAERTGDYSKVTAHKRKMREQASS